MYIYAFGSICRGEVDQYSDIDLLSIVDDDSNSNLNKNVFSIYTIERLSELWSYGNPFAWHLATESRLVFSSNGKDIIRSLNYPNPYKNVKMDCEKFMTLFKVSKAAVEASEISYVFELSNVFLAIRNFATCFNLGFIGKMNFSRLSAFDLGEYSLDLDMKIFLVLMKSRILCTRGIGEDISKSELRSALSSLTSIENWMQNLNSKL